MTLYLLRIFLHYGFVKIKKINKKQMKKLQKLAFILISSKYFMAVHSLDKIFFVGTITHGTLLQKATAR